MTVQKLHGGFDTGLLEDFDRLELLESELIRCLRQFLTAAGASIREAKIDGIERLHIPFCYGGVAMGLAVILVGMVPSRWLISITGKTIHDPPEDLDVSWLLPVIESAVADVCDSSVRWYVSLEDVPMA